MEKQTRKTSVWKINIWTGLWSKSYVYGTRRVTWSSQALPEDMKVVEVCRSLPGRLCQKDQECTALLRSSLSRHSCQTPAISHTCQTPWIILNIFWVHSFWILQISCFKVNCVKGFSWPVVSDDNGHDYHDAGFCLFQIVSEVNWTACQLCIADMGSNLNWHIFIWNYKKA